MLTNERHVSAKSRVSLIFFARIALYDPPKPRSWDISLIQCSLTLSLMSGNSIVWFDPNFESNRFNRKSACLSTVLRDLLHLQNTLTLFNLRNSPLLKPRPRRP